MAVIVGDERVPAEAFWYSIVGDQTHLIDLSPLTRLLFHELRVYTRHDLVEVLTVYGV